MRVLKAFGLALLISGLSGCASYKPVPEGFFASLNEPYRLDSGDSLRISVFGQPGMSDTYAVDQAGYITFPLVGDVPARGRTVDQVRHELARNLRNGYLNDPDLTIQVAQYRPFFIMGEVQQGGQYVYVPSMTVNKAIAAAGGYTPRAQQADVDVTRQVGDRVVTGRVSTARPILPGDTIYVRERWF